MRHFNCSRCALFADREVHLGFPVLHRATAPDRLGVDLVGRAVPDIAVFLDPGHQRSVGLGQRAVGAAMQRRGAQAWLHDLRILFFLHADEQFDVRGVAVELLVVVNRAGHAGGGEVFLRAALEQLAKIAPEVVHAHALPVGEHRPPLRFRQPDVVFVCRFHEITGPF